jgi:phosphatidylglycerophosphate synthase
VPVCVQGFYLAAFGGDVVDGYVARFFDQCSKYGGILDMVTDRVSTAGFLVVLSNLYPDYSFAFTMLLVLDIGSHWFHVMRYVPSLLYEVDLSSCIVQIVISNHVLFVYIGM